MLQHRLGAPAGHKKHDGSQEHPSLLTALIQSTGTMGQPLPAAIRQRLSPNQNPIPLLQPQAPALHQPWCSTGSSFTSKFLSLNQRKKNPQCFSWVRLSSPKARSAPAQAHRRAAVHKVGSREDRARNHLF